MRRRRWAAVAMALALTLTAGCNASRPDDGSGAVTLVFADAYSAKNPVGRGGVKPFLEYVNAHGPAVGLELNEFGSGQLGKQKDLLALLRNGSIDLGPIIPGYLSNELPLSVVGDLPGFAESPCTVARGLLPMVRPGGILYEQELKERGVLGLWTVNLPRSEVFTSGFKVEQPSDLKGKLMASPGGIGDRVLDGLGAAGVAMSMQDLYEGISRKIVVGSIRQPYSIPTYSLEDVFDYATVGANLNAATSIMAISPKVWDRLSTEQQQVLLDASAIAQTSVCESVDEDSKKANNTLREAGVTLVPIEGENKQLWVDAVAPVRESWVDDLESQGLPAGQTLSDLRDAMGKVDR